MSVDPQMLQSYLSMSRPQQAAPTGVGGNMAQLLTALMMAKRMKQQQQPQMQPQTGMTPPMNPTLGGGGGAGIQNVS